MSLRPALPAAPPITRVGATRQSSDELRRVEDENESLRKRLAAQREETRVAQKNVDLLRIELATLKHSNPVVDVAPTSPRPQVSNLVSEHQEEIRALRSKNLREIAELKRAHESELRAARASVYAVKPESSSALSGDGSLVAEIDDLREKNTAFRQKNTELREKNGALEKELAAFRAHVTLPAMPPSGAGASDHDPTLTVRAADDSRGLSPINTSQADDLTKLKGVGPAFAKALRLQGITTFAQIAVWTDADIDSIAPKIKTTPARIKSSGWVESANGLIEKI